METRIFGPPGTGKTTYMARQINNAISKHGGYKIIVSSFTRAAAQELTSRDLPLDQERVGTLHSLCFRQLGHSEIAESHFKEWNEYYPAYALSKGKDTLDESPNESMNMTSGDKVFRDYQICRAQLRPRELWPLSVQGFAAKWEEWKHESYYIDFTDMIELAYRDVSGTPLGATIGFFDEVQDFTPMQLTLIRKWAKDMEFVLLAGDDDQCIYSFAGATPDAFLDPPLPDTQKRVLSQSFRVPGKIHTVAQRWIKQLARREEKQYSPRDEEGELRGINKGNWFRPEYAIHDAEKYLVQGKSVMFLASCSYMLRPLVAVLRKEGIPFHNPYRRTRGDWNPLAISKGNTAADRIMAFLRPDEEAWGKSSRWWTQTDVNSWGTMLRAKETMIKGAKTKLQQMSGSEDVSISQLAELFRPEVMDKILDMDLQWYAKNITAARANALHYAINVVEKLGAKKLREKPQIVIGTIHSVKGGQADAVYLFPDLSRAGMMEWSGAARDSIIRQFYVGMTRARESLVLCPPAGVTRVPLGGLIR